MTREEFKRIVADAANDAELKSSDIPTVDLYVDQIITLHSDKLSEGSARFYDRQLTKTMINNYAKDRVISPVKGKKYTKEQITQILFVYTLKSTLSIGEIKRLLDGAYAIDGFDGKALTELYDKYTSTKELNREYIGDIAERMLESANLDIENDEDFISAIINFASMSAFLKNIAQAMIDERFPISESDLEKEKKIKKEKKEKEKKVTKVSKKDTKKEQ